ncbi:hypothetical protein F5Y10DRAFT_4030 [Nemania abortiva]|nr:hypothetical protein F5Y10DRAFT_4030 [Nemania abortiva]
MAPKTRKKGSNPNPDLPGLFPTHDGSYGINTLINHTEPNTGIAQEQSDDKKWVKSMKGKVAKKYGMNSNLKKAIVQSQKEVEEEEHQSQPPNMDPPDHTSSDSSKPSSSSGPKQPPNKPGGPPKPPDDSGPIPPLAPYVPDYNPNNLPFPEDYDDRPRPPYKPAVLGSANPHSFIGVDQMISPPSETIPFYGMPQGQGSTQPISPGRPESSRSFNYESGLFANATFRTSIQPAVPFGAPQATAQGSNSAVQNQTTTPFGTTAISGESGQFMGEVQQPAPGQQTMGQQSLISPPTSAEAIRGGKLPPNMREQATSPNPPNINLPEGLLVPPVVNTPRPGTGKQNPTKQTQPPKKKPRATNASQQTSPKTGGRTNRRSSRRTKWTRLPSDFIARLIILFLALAVTLWLILSAVPAETDDSDFEPSLPHVNLNTPSFGIGAMWKKISGFFPEIPDIGAGPYESLMNAANEIQPDIRSDEILTEVKVLMPDKIWVQNKDGTLKIAEDFWHALKKLIDHDDSFLRLRNGDISEEHWGALKSRFQSMGGLKTGASTEDTKGFSEQNISQSWNSWLEQNDQAIKNALTGVALTKDDFMKLFQQEVTTYQREIRQELQDLQERIKDITQKMTKFRDDISSSGQINADEVTKLVNDMISKANKNAKLDAVAQGLIKGHVNDVLANQVNFFAIGAGATIDPLLVSQTWKGPKVVFKSKKWLENTYRPRPARAALEPWVQEGECFCAGPDRNNHGVGTNNISVLISRNIIPQHLVVEHILPGATLDPDAMPKEIEVWAYIEELTLRNEVRAFSETQFPDTPKEETLNDGFVKIGHVTYERKNSGDGVQVFKLSDELSRMAAITHNVVIRAINNYGADHTCFYRLRLYGEIVERPDDPPTVDNGWKWF